MYLILRPVIDLNMDIDKEAKKVVWSLQNNKRTKEERNVFKPTGKKPMVKNSIYLVVVLLGLFVLSFLLSQFENNNYEICLTSLLCFFTKENTFFYTFYIFTNITVVVLGIFLAYYIGKTLGNKFRI